MSRSTILLFTQLAMLLLLVVAAAIVSPYFLSVRNIMNILRQASLIIIPAIGQAVVIISGGFDLSVGATLAMGAVVSALLFKLGVPIGVAAGMGLLAGTAAGIANGLMVSRVRLPPFVATYGMMFVLMGISMLLMHGDYIVGFPESFQFIGKGHVGPDVLRLPMPFVVALLTALAIHVLMTRTTLGRRIYAVGANRRAARLSGVHVANVELFVFTLCGFIAAFGGLVVMARMNAAEMRMGDSFLLPVVAAVILGGCSLEGGEGSVWGTFVGGIILTMVTNVMTLAGVPDYWHPAVSGSVIIIAVVLDLWGKRVVAASLGRGDRAQVCEVTPASAGNE